MSLQDFRENNLENKRPESLANLTLPLQGDGYLSPVDWRGEVIYFLLPDRFSDGKESERTELESVITREQWGNWNDWAHSGGDRWQGGTLNGIRSKLTYVKELGVTVIWIGPIFKQRANLNTYHGYGIQDFLDVDPHFGTRADLVNLIKEAHQRELRVILDVIFNHSGWNWNYEERHGGESAPYRSWPGYYSQIHWLDRHGQPNAGSLGEEDGVWPTELQRFESYTRAGEGSLAGETAQNFDDIHAEFRRTDFAGHMRDFNFDRKRTLTDLVNCYKYWIALTDCDGFRLDTLKHVDTGVVRDFCGAIKEFASSLGKVNFFLVGEVAGSDENAERYRKVLKSNLNATLDIGESREALTAVAKGLLPASAYFHKVAAWSDDLGSHRDAGLHHVIILDDHDHVFGTKVRFSSDAAGPYQVVAGVAIQLLSLGIPCIYYGTEQSLAGPPKAQRDKYLPDYGHHDKYLRETMFGASHPRLSGEAGRRTDGIDRSLPGFAAYGVTGKHCFRMKFEAFQAIRTLIAIRQSIPALRFGRQYLRDIMTDHPRFEASKSGDIFAWSRILDEQEVLCVINGHGVKRSSAVIVVDANIHHRREAKLHVLLSSAETLDIQNRTYSRGNILAVERRGHQACVSVRDLMPSEVLVLSNHLLESQSSDALTTSSRNA